VGLYQQPNDWSCGPFALKHALVTLGRLADEASISSVAHPHWWSGTDEVKLARAARHFDCDLPLVRRTDPERARGALVRHMDQKLPVLLCVDNWGHWITAVRHEHDRFVIIDSKEEPVLKVIPWRQLCARWRYVDSDTHETALFDMHPVKPRFRVSAKAQFSVERALFLRRPENAHLAEHWDDYLGDLLDICRPRSSAGNAALSMAEFLRRHSELLVSRVCHWHGDIGRDVISRLLRNFRFVAETYALVIPPSSARRAMADLSILLAFYAAARGGIGAMYDSDDFDD